MLIFGDFAKRTLAISDTEVIVAEGSEGAGIYNKVNGNFKKHLPILINPEGVAESDIVTNAVAVNENIVLMANGGAGLCLSESQGDGTDLVGVLDLNGSINFVASKGDYIIAASGKAGLQIVKLNRPDTSLEARCSDLTAYNGSANLQVDGDQDLGYSGSRQFNQVNVDGSLLLCGNWTVRNNITVNGLMEMNGRIYVGRNNRTRNVIVGRGAELRIEGDLVIYGDLILEDDSTLKFIGSDSRVAIFGSVRRGDNVQVEGDFLDYFNKF